MSGGEKKTKPAEKGGPYVTERAPQSYKDTHIVERSISNAKPRGSPRSEAVPGGGPAHGDWHEPPGGGSSKRDSASLTRRSELSARSWEGSGRPVTGPGWACKAAKAPEAPPACAAAL